MREEDKILLVLDLDETLIYASENPIEQLEIDFRFDKYHVYKRPHLTEFLLSLKDDFKVAVWSSASDDYVKSIVLNSFPENYQLEFIWGRSKCSLKRDMTFDSYYFSKPFKKLKSKGYDLEKILIVDDSPEKTEKNYGNAIYIKEFKGTPDEELKKLSLYLQTFKTISNVRSIEKRGWHLKE